MSNADKFSLSRGLKDVVIAEVTKDDSTGYTASAEVEQLIPAGTITISTDSEKADTYFDNVVFATVGSESSTTVSIEGARLKPTMVAKITGKTVDEATGAVIDNGVYVEKYFAVGARVQMLDGSEALTWFLKGTFAIPEETGRTIDDSTDADGMTLEFTAIATKFQFGTDKGVKRVVVDTTESEVLAEQDFFKQVVTPTNLKTIVKKKVTELSKVDITPDPVTGAIVSQQITLQAVADYTDGTTYKWTGTNVTFEADNEATALVTPSAEAECSVTVTATNGEKVVTDTVTFTPTIA